MKTALRHIYSLILVLALAACGNHDEPDTPKPMDANSRTVLVYIVADNSLGSSDFVNNDINEMIEGYKSLQVDASIHNLLIYVDDRKVNKPTIYKLVKNDKTGTVTKEVVYTYLSENNSADPTVIKDVAQRVYDAYPANSYGFVYWSHGEGWVPYPLLSRSIVPKGGAYEMRWIGVDGTRTNITELADVFEQLKKHLSFILFDACSMFSVETAYDLRNVTDYVIGSPGETPGPGGPYDELVPLMFAKSNVGEAVAKAFYDAYARIYDENATCTNSYWTGGVAIGAIKSSALGSLASATKTALSSVGAYDLDELRNKVLDFDTRNDLYKDSYIGYFDMYGMMEQLLSNKEMSEWVKAYNAAQPYFMATPKIYSMFVNSGGLFSINEAKGITHYIPRKKSSEPNQVPLDQNYQLTNWYKDVGLSVLGW